MKRTSLLAVLLFVPLIAGATMARKDVPFDTMVKDAAYGFVGKCVSVTPDRSIGLSALNPYKMVFELVKISFMNGKKEYKPGDLFEVRVAGLKGVPTCQPGTTAYWLFAKESSLGLTAPINLGEGVYPIDSATQKVVFKGSGRAALFKGVGIRNPSVGKFVGRAEINDLSADELVEMAKKIKEGGNGK